MGMAGRWMSGMVAYRVEFRAKLGLVASFKTEAWAGCQHLNHWLPRKNDNHDAGLLVFGLVIALQDSNLDVLSPRPNWRRICFLTSPPLLIQTTQSQLKIQPRNP
ncbi:hypothetical protein AG1IA_10481 [Rhizoctonia solani AG-1 IA]|uniref:Uncharacterized protein n=1 Tax=Thanatephorus cucumeris (strain AG1-IA) TaxID=983506 RepID=L8WGG2_THACA|nr:hypothetical protein AG1IA_10481 [Rhizoctonia solani AG-1 IA]